MARRTAAAARQTRSAIIDRAVAIAAVDGLEGVTIGRLAADLEMSKSGVLNHFRTKELLQLAVLEAVEETFRERVWKGVRAEKPGLRRLLAAHDAWLDHITAEGSAGCFWTAAASEFDGRPGPVRDAVAASLATWYATLRREVAHAVEAGELPAGTDPDQVVFELRGVVMAANQQVQLLDDPESRDGPRRARAAVRRIVGLQT